jgi:hypothetical protein
MFFLTERLVTAILLSRIAVPGAVRALGPEHPD